MYNFLIKSIFFIKKDFLLDYLNFFNKINTESFTENEANFYKNEIEYFNENDSEFPELNRFELARRIWNINHMDNEVPKIEMPNYKNVKA